MGSLLQDLRHGLRALVKNPGFATVAVLTLGLGVGANTAIFSVVRATLLTPMAIPEPERVVVVWTENREHGYQLHHVPASIPDFEDWKGSGIFEQLGAMRDGGFNLRIGDRSERVTGLFVTEGWFGALGIKAWLGRLYNAADMQPGHDLVVILSHDYWSNTFASDPGVIGKSVTLDGEARTVVGVLPKTFPKMESEQIYAPLVFGAPAATDRGTRFISVVGRLRRGVPLAATQHRMDELSSRLGRQYAYDAGNTVALQPIEEALVEDYEALVLVVAGAVGIVLLISCANIANLLLARGTERTREMAVRAALGAGRWMLARQMMAESTVLALAGGLLGALVAAWGIEFLKWFKLEDLPNPEQVRLDTGVLAFNFCLAFVTGVLFGLAPAWQAWKTDVNDTLKAAGRGLSSGVRQRLRGLLVVSETALTLVLLVGGGLMLKSFAALRSADLGFNPHGMLTMQVALSEHQYPTPEKQMAYFDEALHRLRVLPGVVGAAAIDGLPGGDSIHGSGLRRADRPEPKLADVPIVLINSVTPDYFRTMQTRLVRGRFFTNADRTGAPPVAIIDVWAAQRYWRGEDPVGKSLRLESAGPAREIIGVVGNVSQGILIKMVKGQLGQVYVPLAQAPKANLSVGLRTTVEPTALTGSAQKTLREIDPNEPVFLVRDMDASRAASEAPQTLATALLGGFAGVALLLAMIGIYGIVAYSAGRRMREIGIRVALGAQRRDVLRLLVGQGMLLAVAGIAVGLAGAWVLARQMASLLSGVEPNDPATFACVCALLTAAAGAASYVPARRAMRVDPVEALRQE